MWERNYGLKTEIIEVWSDLWSKICYKTFVHINMNKEKRVSKTPIGSIVKMVLDVAEWVGKNKQRCAI